MNGIYSPLLVYPHQRAARQLFEKRNQIGIGQVNATARIRFSDGGLIACSVNINIACVRIYITAAIEARLKAFQPHYTRRNPGIRQPFPCVANWLSLFEGCAAWPAAADLFCNAMQSQRRAIGAFRLPNAKARSRAAELFYELVIGTAAWIARDFLQERNTLISNADEKSEPGRSYAISSATIQKCVHVQRKRYCNRARMLF